MKRLFVLLPAVVLFGVHGVLPAAKPETRPLMQYVARKDGEYEWFKKYQGSLGTAKYVELILTSQTWRGIPWQHQLFIVKPSTAKQTTGHGLLIVTGGRWKDEFADPEHRTELPKEAILFAAMAERLQTPMAVLRQVPRQPMFDGRVEDEIIAYTFEKFLQTKETDWPLLLPMVKSTVRAMDAVQEFARDAWSMELETFTVTGGSKRGWTTWLTGAVDDRATTLVPLVFDVLNMAPQMKHQKRAWGDFSYKIRDYSERDLPEKLASRDGQALRRLVDPYSYRKDLTQPKLIILGTNDHYWPIDALNLYWDELPEPKYVLYVPNNRHGLTDYGRVFNALGAVHRHAVADTTLPELTWQFVREGDRLSLEITSDVRPRRVALWTATAEKRDFRESTWESRSVERGDGRYTAEIPVPGSGYAVAFGEAVFEGETGEYSLSTTVRVVGPQGETSEK